jgi:virginiamycin B lyase
VWFTQAAADRIGSFAGGLTEAKGPTPGSVPTGVAIGADGSPWFTERNGGRIGRFDAFTGTVTEFSSGITVGSHPFGITAGPDGNLWFAEESNRAVGRITTAGAVTEFSTGITGFTQWITVGPDGNLWFTEYGENKIGRITTAGVVTEYLIKVLVPGPVTLGPGAGPQQITAGPDDNIWYAAFGRNAIGRLTLDPAATTGSASSIGGAAATLSGTVNPFGALTSYVFQYGRSTVYGASTGSRTRTPGSGSATVAIDATGLQPNTLYHYRLVASSSAGTAFGADRTFTTAGPGTPGGSAAGSPGGTAPRMVIRSRRLSMTRSGRVLVRIACPLAETLGCKGTVRIETAAKLRGTAGKRRLALGSKRFQVGGGQTRTVSVRLSRRGRALARSALGVLVRTIVVASDADGNRATTLKVLRLRAVKRA